MKHAPEWLPIKCAECGTRGRFDRTTVDTTAEVAWYECPGCESYHVKLVL